MIRTGQILLLFACVLSACRKDPAVVEEAVDHPFDLELPAGFPALPVPPENPLTAASVELGKLLFFDPRLSRDGSIACASCHHPARAFSDTVALSTGVDGALGMRNSPSLANVGYHPRLFRDGGIPTLERQVLAPISDPVEMAHSIELAASAVAVEAEYQRLSQLAYERPIDAYVVTRALASYERTLVSGWSPYDRYLRGDTSALSESEVHGLELFNSETLGCTACHSGFDLSDHSFQNIGQYLDYADPGRERITQDPSDEGKFKVPTLRNVALTAPYMHDGAMTSLDEVIDHFASGGLPHPNRSSILTNFVLTAEEKASLIAFLNALTDERSLDQVP